MEQRGGQRYPRPTNGPSVTDRNPEKREAALEALTGSLRALHKLGNNAFRHGERGLTFLSRKR